MRIAFTIHITNTAGMLAIPQLLTLFESYKLPAHFFLALGQDIRPSIKHRLMPLSLLDRNKNTRLGRQFNEQLLSIQQAGFTSGISALHPFIWNDKVPFQKEDWIKTQLHQAMDAYESLFQEKALSHAAYQWQTQQQLFSIEKEAGLSFCSDVRGKYAFYPEQGCMQIPTTLPTFRELLSRGISFDKLHEEMFFESQPILPTGHVLHIDADHDVNLVFSVLEACLVMWKGANFEMVTLDDIHQMLQTEAVPKHHIGWSQVNGSERQMAQQGSMIGSNE